MTNPTFSDQDDGVVRASPHALKIDDYVPAYLTFLANKLSSSASVAYRREFGIGITDWRIMALLAIEPWSVAGRICNIIGLDKAAVSRSVREMVQNGLVEVRTHENNQRRQYIALTPAGVELHDRVVKLAMDREQDLLTGFSTEERKQLIGFLSRMLSRLGDVKIDDSDDETCG